jgi:hypothetical protein
MAWCRLMVKVRSQEGEREGDKREDSFGEARNGVGFWDFVVVANIRNGATPTDLCFVW